MIHVFKKIWAFAGEEQSNIRNSIILAFFNAVFYAIQFGAVYVVLAAVVSQKLDSIVAWQAFGLMAISILGRIFLQTFSQLKRVHAGYFMVANKRIRIGDKLRVVPMGYFNKNSLGQITAVTTTTLTDVENAAPVVLVTILGGVINSLVFGIFILLFDWRIGLLTFAGMLVFLLTTALLERKSRNAAPRRQRAQEELVEKVLENVQGMSVVKSFHLTGKMAGKVNTAIDESCRRNLEIEKEITPYTSLQQILLNLFSVIIMVGAIWLYLNGQMALVKAMTMLIYSFMVFEQLKSAGSNIANLRITEASIDKANQIDKVPVMAEGSAKLAAAEADICFDQVSFAYEKRAILKDISFTIPARTTTAIIGPSGSGKSTLCNLIARFWDADSGAVTIGGTNIRDCSLESLMSNISMVFQNVYLFSDTVENNIKFGRPKASHEEVVAAAQKACCHDFIMALPNGYDTVLEEGGSSLSGGEKQRLSIARAMLKDAPVIILDEATANVDPENEDRLQLAIESLMRNKTIVMIAHRLKTVQNADQILVLDDGAIVQRGKHAELLKETGIYAQFVNRRQREIGWKL